MSSSDLTEEVRALAANLASLWNGGRSVLDRLVAAAGDPKLSPAGALRALGPGEIDELFIADPESVHSAFRSLTGYLTEETWFDRAIDPNRGLGENAGVATLRERPIAYFCMEYGLASWLPIYSGGLGILAGDILKEASDLGLPMVAIGLFYRHGFFYQKLDDANYQTEIIPSLDPATLPLEAVTDRQGRELRISIPIEDRAVWMRAWKLQVGRIPLYLLDTNIEENEREADRDITASLYGGGTDTRIQQELVLGVGGMQMLDALGIRPSVFSMNEGHAAFLALELIARENRSVDLDSALERARAQVVYTNHTVIAAGNDVFERQLIRRYLGSYALEAGLDLEAIIGLATRGPDDGFSMALLAFAISGKANGVSELHAQVIPREWPGYAVEAVTNGVHVPTWLGDEMHHLLDEYVVDWRGDEPDWERIRSIPDGRLQQARDAQRRRLVQFVNRRQTSVVMDESVLTIVWARRFAEYKRAWLIASDLDRLSAILGQSDRPVQLVIAGKSHPRDEGGKQILKGLLNRLSEDSAVASRVAFIEDYDEEVARHLTLGADVWLNTPRKPLEASGTSGMKSSDNGGLQLTVTDGWAAEVDWWGTGWGVGGENDATDAEQIYWFLEDSIVPCFYERNAEGIAETWVAMMKNTMIVTLSRYSARRMLLEYLRKLYLPLLAQTEDVHQVG